MLFSITFISWSISSNDTLSELFAVTTFVFYATSSALNTVDVDLAGPAINGSENMLVNVLSTVTINELVELKIINIREYKFQHCDLSSCMSGKNNVFASLETYVATSSLTRRCSKDQKPCHNVVLRHWIKAEWKLTLLIPSVRLNWRLLSSSHNTISAKELYFNFKEALFSRLSWMGLN